jgi:sigma-B regulation protein RsbU (phosphoserine phosphatase)
MEDCMPMNPNDAWGRFNRIGLSRFSCSWRLNLVNLLGEQQSDQTAAGDHNVRKVQHGLFETRVRVTSNDEIGYTGDVINAMTEGLIERDRIKQSLSLAKEIQQNLLPKDTWKLDGFDMAGKSEYCDETGGDYFDFIHAVGGEDHKLGVVIGDVSGHGISSALLMATVRSALRQRAFHPGSAAQIISDVNRQLVQDIEPSQFRPCFS